MNKDELAKLLDGRQYGVEINEKEAQLARGNNLVVVFGASDDLMELRGAIYDEVGCWSGRVAYLCKSGVFESCDDDDAFDEYEQSAKVAQCKSIQAIWCGGV
jgi:hypothetical protein